MCGGEPVFAGEEGVYTLDGTAAWDYLPEKTPIEGSGSRDLWSWTGCAP